MKTIVLLLACTASSLFAQEKFDISLDWKSGRQYVQNLQLQQVVGVPRHGEAKAKTSLQLGFKLDASKSLNVQFDAMKILVDLPLPAKNEEFDSAKPLEGNQDIGSFFRSMTEKEPKMLLDGRGKVREVRGLDQLTSQNALIGRFFGKDQIKSLLQQGWLVEFPKASVSKGDSWPFKMQFPSPVGQLLIKGNYTMGGRTEKAGSPLVEILVNGLVEGDFSKLSAEHAKETDPELLKIQATMLLMGIKVKEGTLSGSIFYNPTSRMLHSSETETMIRLSVAKYPENGKPTEIPIQQTMALTLTERAADK